MILRTNNNWLSVQVQYEYRDMVLRLFLCFLYVAATSSFRPIQNPLFSNRLSIKSSAQDDSAAEEIRKLAEFDDQLGGNKKLKDYLKEQKWPTGLQSSLASELGRVAKRYYILDNVGG